MLNLHEYNKKLLVTEENILSLINEYSIFKSCVGDFDIGKPIKSPLKNKDDHPSFGIYKSKKIENKLLFMDLSTGEKGSCFNLIQKLYNLSYVDALFATINSFHLQEHFVTKKDVEIKFNAVVEESPTIKKDKRINVRIREFKRHDIEYWNQYGISIETLRLFNVFPIEYYFIEDKIFLAHKYAYAYLEFYNNDYRYKIYQPYEIKEKKWFNDLLPDTISGLNTLDFSKKEVFITSSKKDSMTIYSLGFNSINPQTESYNFKEDFINFLKEKFDTIYSFYDYDKAGIKNAYKLKRQFGIIPIFTKSPKNKDISDLIKSYGKTNRQNIKKIFYK